MVATWKSQTDAKGLHVDVETCKSPIYVEADVVRLTQALNCVIDNAVKFTAPGGRVTIKAGLTDGGTQAFVKVRDTGIGISAADLPTIFEPVRRAASGGPSQRGGLGLSMTLAKGLVELHGGSIAVESEGLGKGACFCLHLPLAARLIGESSDDGATAKKWPLRILIIDDSPDVATSLQFLLKHAGHALFVAPDGTRGIEAARRQSPDVVLCDIGLPDMDGYAVARSLRADPATEKSYLIAVSGYGSEQDKRRSLEAGFDLHLNKPEGFIGLSERLASLPIGDL
jgi:CheY-like chemotaxis protein